MFRGEPPDGNPGSDPPPRSTTVFDLVSRVALPVTLAIIGSLQTQRDRFWAGLGLAAVAFVAGLWRPTASAVRRRWHRWHDERAARRSLPPLGRLIRRFGEFVMTGRTDSLEAIVQQHVGARDATAAAKLRLPPERLIENAHYYLSTRLRAAAPKLALLEQTVTEFNTLLTDYLLYYVRPVFQDMPADLRASLSPRARSELEEFRQRLARLCEECEAFLRATEESLL